MRRTQETWVLLAYRLPREPSTPRSAVWRQLKRLGVVQLADGVVALPADARTREQLEWIAEEVVDNGGEATVWLSQPADDKAEAELVRRMAAVIAAEYEAVTEQARTLGGDADGAMRRRLAARLRRELRRIGERDYFPPPQRDTARHAVEELAARADKVPDEAASR